MTAATLISKRSSDGGLTKFGVTPLGGAAAGISDSGTPGGRFRDMVEEELAVRRV